MGKLMCPLCGAYTSFTPARVSGEGIIEDASTNRNLTIRNISIGAIACDHTGLPNFAILTCQACENRFVAEEVAGEWVAVYPLPHKPVNEYIPEPIRSELEEANLCFAVGANRAAVSMCATALEAMWREQGVSSLQELREKGIISQKLHKQADQIRRWANVAKHEPIHEAVTREEAEQLLSYLERVLDDVYVEEKHLSSLTEKLQRVQKKASDKAQVEVTSRQINLEFVRRHWKEITKSMSGEGEHGNLDAILRSSCVPVGLDNATLTLGFYHKFHLEYMQKKGYPMLLETKISEALGMPMKVKYVLIQRSGP